MPGNSGSEICENFIFFLHLVQPLPLAYCFVRSGPFVGEIFLVVLAMATSENGFSLSQPRRPSTRATSSSDDVTGLPRATPNSAALSTENSFSVPLISPSSQNEAVKKRCGRPKKDKTGSTAGEQAQPNSQSVSTSEVWCCKVCKVIFTDESDKLMQCERCDGATCIQCLNMESKVYDLLKGRMDLHWYCGECDKQAMAAIKADWEIEEKCAAYMSSLTLRMDSMQQEINRKAEKATVDTTNIRLDGTNSDIVKLSDKIELLYREPEEIEKRKNNIVIRGIPEHEGRGSNGEEEDEEDNDDDVSNHDVMSDIDACTELLHSIGVDITPKSVHRIGKKYDGRSRPLKVILNSEKEKQCAIRSGPKVRSVNPTSVSFDPTRVFISPDMTILQRQEDIKLRDELKKKRLSNPNWTIRGKKLILRNPPAPPDPPPGGEEGDEEQQ